MKFFRRLVEAKDTNPLSRFSFSLTGPFDYHFTVNVGDVTLHFKGEGTPNNYPSLYENSVPSALRKAWTLRGVMQETKVLFGKNNYSEIYHERARDLLHRDMEMWRILSGFSQLTITERKALSRTVEARVSTATGNWTSLRSDLVSFAQMAPDTPVGELTAALREDSTVDHSELDKAYMEFKKVYLKTYNRDHLEIS